MYRHEYKYLTREMIENVEVQVEPRMKELLYEIRMYNESLPECKRKKQLVDFIRLGYLISGVLIAVIMAFINLTASSDGESAMHVYIVAAMYGIGILFLLVIRQSFNCIVHAFVSAILLIAGWNYIFMIPISIGICKLYERKHLELIELYGYPSFNEVKMVILDNDMIELMRIHKQGQNYLKKNAWQEPYRL